MIKCLNHHCFSPWKLTDEGDHISDLEKMFFSIFAT